MLWTIDRIVSSKPYFRAAVPNHPSANVHGHVDHHRVVIECYLRRLLCPGEVVHHINENQQDNTLENLALLTKQEHARWHSQTKAQMVRFVCPACSDVFTCRRGNTHLCKSRSGSGYTCRSRSCATSFGHKRKQDSRTPAVQQAIQRNVVSEFVRTVKRTPPKSILETHETEEDLELLRKLCDVTTINAEYRTRVGRKAFRRRLANKTPKIVAQCVRCAVEFEKTTHRQKYCSLDCSRHSSRKVKRPTPEKLHRLVWKYPTSYIAERFGVSSNAVAKWCRSYGIEKPPRGYWAKQRAKS